MTPSRFPASRIGALAVLCATLCAAQAPTPSVAPAKAASTTPIPTLRVDASSKTGFTTVQAAVDAAPDTGAVILIAKGTYREIVKIHKSNITLRGDDPDASKTVIVDDHNAGENGGTFASSTVFVYADDFHADHITFANDFNRTHPQSREGSQALALLLQGDRNLLRHVILLGNQDTLFAGHHGCMNTAGKDCSPARSYFSDCLIAGNVDFIFGDGAAVFDHCEIRSTAHGPGGFLTAQSRVAADEPGSVYVFTHCTLTAEPGAGAVFLGRPWRPYAAVIYLHTVMGEQIDPAGWHEWHPGETTSLETATYAEFDSTGPGATPAKLAQREPHSKQLTAAEAEAYSTHAVLSGTDNWDPEKIR